MSQFQLTHSIAAIRTALANGAMMTMDELIRMTGDTAHEAVEHLFKNGEVAETRAAGIVFYTKNDQELRQLHAS